MFSRLSLLWKILLPTFVVVTVVFVVTGWIVQNSVIRTTNASVEQEVKAGFETYASVWKARANLLLSVTRVLSTMSDVRAAFSTGDQATIRDTAGELWSKVSSENAFFLVSDAQGRIIASLGAPAELNVDSDLPAVRQAAAHFPAQASGFLQERGQLFQIVLTPVYVEGASAPQLLNVLIAGFQVDTAVAERLKRSTGESEFLFWAGGEVIASTLGPDATATVSSQLRRALNGQQLEIENVHYVPYSAELPGIDGAPIGRLFVFRSFRGAGKRMNALRRDLALLWLIALLTALPVMYFVARRIMKPVQELDRAAAELARENYDCHVPVRSHDELGRLAQTFNGMCESIRKAREELIRQERIATIGRLSTSIVHDLRNPLAAIYAGAEMLADKEMLPQQTRRLARNIYRASQGIQELLQQLLNVSRGKSGQLESCELEDVVTGAWDFVADRAEARNVRLQKESSLAVECSVERGRVERVFVNLFDNAIQAMPAGGAVTVRLETRGSDVIIAVSDTGPGVRPDIRDRLFEPFVSTARNGLGLGLALSRQTLLDHGGDLWLDPNHTSGACFLMRLRCHLPDACALEKT